MKKFMVVIAIILILTISALVIFGCGEKKTEQKVEEEVEQIQEEAVMDTAVVDTAAVDTTQQ